MSIVKTASKTKVLSIDPSSKHYAFAVVTNTKLIASGKVDFPKNSSLSEKFQIIDSSLPLLIQKYKPKQVVIEETVYLQNPNTTRLLAYIVGGLWSTALRHCSEVRDANPMTWKSGIGYKNVSASEKRTWGQSMTDLEVRKKAAFERKDRVRRIIDTKYPNHGVTDTDIIDAIAIGYWVVKR